MLNTAARARLCKGLLALLAGAGLAGCSHWPVHWPWHHHSPPGPQPVSELSIQATADNSPGASGAIQQFWDRNTLLLDLTAVGSEGAVTLAPTSHGWPVRLEFRVQPGRMARLEVQGRERVVFEVPAQGKPLLLQLATGAYVPDTPQITLRWSAADDSAR